MKVDKAKANLQMVGSRIVSLNIKNMFVFLDSADKDIKRKIDVSYNVDEPFTAPAGNGEYICTIRLKVEVEIEREEKTANIRLVTEGAFVLDQNDKDTLKTMTSVNGSAALYSIARGIIASVSGQMCEGGGIIIPMLNVYEMNKELQK